MAPGRCELRSPSSTFDSRRVPGEPRTSREGIPWIREGGAKTAAEAAKDHLIEGDLHRFSADCIQSQEWNGKGNGLAEPPAGLQMSPPGSLEPPSCCPASYPPI
ncbi:hypothetical protein MC885_018186 [Smutsia gigantea]|nr:hypothetical protein MC885_018186 [Smutsia gigantea]